MTRWPIGEDGEELTAADLLTHALWAGVRIWLEGRELRCDGHISPRFAALLSWYRADMILILRGRLCRICATPMTRANPAELWLPDGTRLCRLCVEEWELLGPDRAARCDELARVPAAEC